MFFLFKVLLLVVVATALVRAGMHAQQLVDEGVSPWTGDGIEEVGLRLQADVDGLLHIIG